MGKVKDSKYDGNCTARHFRFGTLENFRPMDFCWTECTYSFLPESEYI